MFSTFDESLASNDMILGKLGTELYLQSNILTYIGMNKTYLFNVVKDVEHTFA